MDILINKLDKLDNQYSYLGGIIKNPALKNVIKLFSLNPKGTYILLLVANYSLFQNRFLFNIIFCFVSDLIIFVLKRIIKRGRPQKYNSSLLMRLVGLGPDNYSFPSAHTFTVFQVLILAFKMFGIAGLLFVTYAFMVGISRITLKHHHLSDVLAGALLGIIFGLINITFIN